MAGHRRYAHITALRGDAVAAQALGMNKVVSEDALRRALESDAPGGDRAPAHPGRDRARAGWMASSSDSIWLAPACTREIGCGSMR